MGSEYKTKFPIFWIIILFAALLDLLIVWLIVRRPWSKVFMWYMITLFILTIIGLIIGGVVWLFMPHKRSNIIYMKNQIIKACNYNHREGPLQKLYFQGDDGLGFRFIGYVSGVCAIRSEPKRELKQDNRGRQIAPIMENTDKPMFFISFTKSPPNFITSIFGSKEICGVFSEDIIGGEHALNWDIIRLSDSSFTIPVAGIFYLKKYYKNTAVIDEPISNIIYRFTLMDSLDQLKSITDNFMQLNPKFKFEQESNNLNVMTQPTGGAAAPGRG